MKEDLVLVLEMTATKKFHNPNQQYYAFVVTILSIHCRLSSAKWSINVHK
jgi:hypothetical protein